MIDRVADVAAPDLDRQLLTVTVGEIASRSMYSMIEEALLRDAPVVAASSRWSRIRCSWMQSPNSDSTRSSNVVRMSSTRKVRLQLSTIVCESGRRARPTGIPRPAANDQSTPSMLSRIAFVGRQLEVDQVVDSDIGAVVNLAVKRPGVLEVVERRLDASSSVSCADDLDADDVVHPLPVRVESEPARADTVGDQAFGGPAHRRRGVPGGLSISRQPGAAARGAGWRQAPGRRRRSHRSAGRRPGATPCRRSAGSACVGPSPPACRCRG